MLVCFPSRAETRRGDKGERTEHRIKSVMGQTSELSHPYQPPSIHPRIPILIPIKPRVSYHHDDGRNGDTEYK